MKEVSCQLLDAFFREGRRKKVPAEALAAGTGYPLSHLEDKHERIEWSAYRRFVANAGRHWSSDELVDMGGAFTRSPLVRSMNVVARLLFTPRDFYGWMASPGKGAGNQLVTCIEPRLEELGPRHIAIELELAAGYDTCPEFFLLTLGSFRALPRVLGLPMSRVEYSQQGRTARYDIQYPPGGGALGWLRRATTWLFTARAAARELQESHRVLRARYDELDKAKGVLASQATQLRTAYTIGQLVHGDLDLERTLGAVAHALVDEAGFGAARVRIAVDVEGAHVERASEAGAVPGGAPTVAVPLAGRSRALGTLEVWGGREGSDALVEMVVPTISTVVEDALTYGALLDYRKNLEVKVDTRTAELRQARDQLADTVVSLQEARRSRDKIFSNINHEIRTPLSLMTLAVKDLRGRLAERPEPPVEARLDTIDRGVSRLLRLVDGLLLLAAGQERKLELRFATFELPELLRSVIVSWGPLAAEHGLSLGLDTPESLRVRADEMALERVLGNLVSNAVKFTPAGGRIDVGLAPTDAGLDLTVRDTGVGISEEFKGRIFGRFEQGAAPVRATGRGSGIGLSLVKELVEAHGGTVAVETPEGGGTLFRVSLPRALADTAGDAPSVAASAMPREAPTAFAIDARTEAPAEDVVAPTSFAATVLVAEDEPELRQAIGDLLGGTYRVYLAPDGVAALELAEKVMPDILVTDVGMPGMDGLELTRRFRALPGNRLAPVLLVTAFANLADRLKGFEAGAVDYVCKPFEPEELRARVRSLLALRALALKLHDAEKLAALGTLSAGMAHEMRNPANAIVNAVDPIRELLPPEALADVGELLDVLKDCAGQIATLSRQLLGFKRHGELVREEVAVEGMVKRAVSLVKPLLQGLDLRRGAPYEGKVPCAPALMTQVLGNLLENAVHAAGPGGWIAIATRREGERVVIEVSDSGPGVPAALRERIFEPFFTTKPPGLGTGLGLATAREIVGRHGGSLDVRDGAAGAVFRIELPVAMGVGPRATSVSLS